jgi:hypothetical protein
MFAKANSGDISLSELYIRMVEGIDFVINNLEKVYH